MGFTKRISVSCKTCQFNNGEVCMISRRINGKRKLTCISIDEAKELFPYGCIEWKVGFDLYMKNYKMLEEEM